MAQTDVKYQIKGGFFNAKFIGEQGTEEPVFSYDRLYDSEDMIQPYRNIVTDGIFAYKTSVGSEESVLKMGFDLSVLGNNEVSLTVGSGILNHHWFELEHIQNIDIATNYNAWTRIDSLIIQCNMSSLDRCFYLIYRQGTASQPALETDNSTIFEIRLWNIEVPYFNASNLTPNLTDMRATDECPVITGLLQQLSLEDRLNKFDEDVAEKLDEIDDTLNEKIEGYDTQFQQKIEQYDAEYNTKISQYDSQFQQKLQSYDNSMTQIWAEWEALKSQIGSGGGGGIIIQGSTLSITRGYISYTSGTVAISDYDAETDTIFVFINGLYANTTNDYSIDSSGVITFKNTISSGADIDWWKFRITEAQGGGGGTEEPTQGFSLAIRSYEGTDITPEEDGSYKLLEGTSYFAVAPSFMGTYRWETQDGSDNWNPVSDESNTTLIISGGEHTALRCIVNYNDTDYISATVTFTIAISGTVEDPVIQITEDDGYVHQTEASEPEPTQKVATPVIEVS